LLLCLVVHPATPDVQRALQELEVEPPEAEPALGVLEGPEAAGGPRVHGGLRDLTLDPVARRCLVGDTEVALRPKEFDLLARLASEPGRAVTREALMDDVWDRNWFGSTKTLDVHVAAVRRKLRAAADAMEPPGHIPQINTLRSHGYRLDADPAPAG